jgi:hypothetical protein
MNNSTTGEDDMSAQIIRFPKPHRSRVLDAADILTSVFGHAEPSAELDALIAELDSAIVSKCPLVMGLCADRIAQWDAAKRA